VAAGPTLHQLQPSVEFTKNGDTRNGDNQHQQWKALEHNVRHQASDFISLSCLLLHQLQSAAPGQSFSMLWMFFTCL
jgi:hypothetical protein